MFPSLVHTLSLLETVRINVALLLPRYCIGNEPTQADHSESHPMLRKAATAGIADDSSEDRRATLFTLCGEGDFLGAMEVGLRRCLDAEAAVNTSVDAGGNDDGEEECAPAAAASAAVCEQDLWDDVHVAVLNHPDLNPREALLALSSLSASFESPLAAAELLRSAHTIAEAFQQRILSPPGTSDGGGRRSIQRNACRWIDSFAAVVDRAAGILLPHDATASIPMSLDAADGAQSMLSDVTTMGQTMVGTGSSVVSPGRGPTNANGGTQIDEERGNCTDEAVQRSSSSLVLSLLLVLEKLAAEGDDAASGEAFLTVGSTALRMLATVAAGTGSNLPQQATSAPLPVGSSSGGVEASRTADTPAARSHEKSGSITAVGSGELDLYTAACRLYRERSAPVRSSPRPPRRVSAATFPATSSSPAGVPGPPRHADPQLSAAKGNGATDVGLPGALWEGDAVAILDVASRCFEEFFARAPPSGAPERGWLRDICRSLLIAASGAAAAVTEDAADDAEGTRTAWPPHRLGLSLLVREWIGTAPLRQLLYEARRRTPPLCGVAPHKKGGRPRTFRYPWPRELMDTPGEAATSDDASSSSTSSETSSSGSDEADKGDERRRGRGTAAPTAEMAMQSGKWRRRFQRSLDHQQQKQRHRRASTHSTLAAATDLPLRLVSSSEEEEEDVAVDGNEEDDSATASHRRRPKAAADPHHSSTDDLLSPFHRGLRRLLDPVGVLWALWLYGNEEEQCPSVRKNAGTTHDRDRSSRAEHADAAIADRAVTAARSSNASRCGGSAETLLVWVKGSERRTPFRPQGGSTVHLEMVCLLAGLRSPSLRTRQVALLRISELFLCVPKYSMAFRGEAGLKWTDHGEAAGATDSSTTAGSRGATASAAMLDPVCQTAAFERVYLLAQELINQATMLSHPSARRLATELFMLLPSLLAGRAGLKLLVILLHQCPFAAAASLVMAALKQSVGCDVALQQQLLTSLGNSASSALADVNFVLTDKRSRSPWLRGTTIRVAVSLLLKRLGTWEARHATTSATTANRQHVPSVALAAASSHAESDDATALTVMTDLVHLVRMLLQADRALHGAILSWRSRFVPWVQRPPRAGAPPNATTAAAAPSSTQSPPAGEGLAATPVPAVAPRRSLAFPLEDVVLEKLRALADKLSSTASSPLRGFPPGASYSLSMAVDFLAREAQLSRRW